jgi:hypothetical protein
MAVFVKQVADQKQSVKHTLPVIFSCASTAPGVPMERLPSVGLVFYPQDVPTAHRKKEHPVAPLISQSFHFQ